MPELPRAVDPAGDLVGHIDEPALELVTRLTVHVDRPVEAGVTGQGLRRIIPISGGTAVGPGFDGTIEPGGSDVQLIRHDGVADIAARFPDCVRIDVYRVT